MLIVALVSEYLRYGQSAVPWENAVVLRMGKRRNAHLGVHFEMVPGEQMLEGYVGKRDAGNPGMDRKIRGLDMADSKKEEILAEAEGIVNESKQSWQISVTTFFAALLQMTQAAGPDASANKV